jgi:hypothetical protein
MLGMERRSSCWEIYRGFGEHSRPLESKYGITVTTSHISGKRMIAKGADGLSQSLLNKGVMAGDSIISFLPFHLSAVKRLPAVFDWVSSWADEMSYFSHPRDGLSEAMIKLEVRCGLTVSGVPNSNAVAISGLPHRQLRMLHWKSYVSLV